MRILFISWFVFSSVFASFGQGVCGTEATDEQMHFMRSISSGLDRQRALASTVVNIPLTIHVIRMDDGTGGLTESQVNQAVQRTNTYYQNSSMRFFISGGIRYVDSSEFFDLTSAEEGKLAVPNDVAGTINIYFSSTLSSNGTPLCGYTRFPPSADRVFVANPCVFGGTFEHELGHYFTLYHTHGKTNTGTTDELVNGSNCTVAGDDICDTPADPNLTGNVSSNCQYTGFGKDANGQFYAPNPRNIMAYSLDQCQDYFSPGQYQRIRNGFENGRSYLNFTSEGFTALFTSDISEGCPGAVVNFQAVSFGAVSYQWEFPGGTPSTLTGTSAKARVTYNTAGLFDVRLRAFNSAGEEAVSFRTEFISITDPLAFATSGELIENFDGEEMPVGWQTSATNGGLSFGISAIDSNPEQNESNSLFMNNFGNDGIDRSVSSIILPAYDMVGIRGFSVSFDYAYTFRPEFFDGNQAYVPRYDTLSLDIITSCTGESSEIWKKGGTSLATAPSSLSPFVPESDDWRSVSFYHGFTTKVDFTKFLFNVISRNGNNLYIDNVSLIPDYDLAAPTFLRITESSPESVSLRWTDRSINELGFIIRRGLNGGSLIDIDTVETNVTTFTDSDNSLEGEYTYVVLAMGIEDNLSMPSNSVDHVVTSSGLIDSSVLNAWPNPADGFMYIESRLAGDFKIVDITGRIVEAGFMAEMQVLEFESVSVSPGIYIFELNDISGQLHSMKLLIK